MKKTSFLSKIIFKSTLPLRISVRLGLLVLIIWCATLVLLNRNTALYHWFVSDVDSLRALLGSLFQGLAAFFAIVISVSLLVAQLAYGSFSPRMMPNFLRDRTFLLVVFLFIGTLAINLVILLFLNDETIHNLLPLIVLDLLMSAASLISVVPASFELLNSAHPMRMGWKLIERFNEDYFNEIPFQDDLSTDDNLPKLQSLIVKAIRDSDTDYAKRLIGSFRVKVEKHLNNNNAVLFSGYFDSFFKKIAFVASKENEGDILEQLVFMNESLENKASKSNAYLSNTDMRFEGSFAKNILYIIKLSIKDHHDQVIGRAQGAIHRLREVLVSSMPEDDQISRFRTALRFRDNKEDMENTNVHYANERIYEYINAVYFQSNAALATEALKLNNKEVAKDFIREIFRSRYALEKLNSAKHKEIIRGIAYSDFFNLSRLSHLAIEGNISISDDVAIGIHEARDFFLKIDPNLAENYIDLLGQLMIETMEREVPDGDPTSTFYWAGVAFRMFLHPAPVHLPIKLLGYFEKVLNIIKKKQEKSSSPILEKIKETICEEIASIGNYKDSDKNITKRAEEILSQYPEIKPKVY